MQEITISVTQAARKFADCINRVHYQGASFVLQKNGIPVARIVPVGSTSSEFERLAVALREAREEAALDQEAAVQLIAHPAEPKAAEPQNPPRRPRLNW
jgi:antitoxin (DNA-binding transcriptional repressor) of toxin-antitoxin stability system